jgi:hypothetical protein
MTMATDLCDIQTPLECCWTGLRHALSPKEVFEMPMRERRSEAEFPVSLRPFKVSVFTPRNGPCADPLPG